MHAGAWFPGPLAAAADQAPDESLACVTQALD
jgi:hypothetical protein